MISKPINRDQARQNAISAALNATADGGFTSSTKYWANVSQAWSAIAETFPHEDVKVEVNEEAMADGFYLPANNDPRHSMALTDDEAETIHALRAGTAGVVLVRSSVRDTVIS